jgi:hypothetical protein
MPYRGLPKETVQLLKRTDAVLGDSRAVLDHLSSTQALLRLTLAKRAELARWTDALPPRPIRFDQDHG